MSDFDISREMRARGAVQSDRTHHFNVYYNAQGDRWCGRSQHWVNQEDFNKASQWCKACRSAYAKERYDPLAKRHAHFKYYYGHHSDLYWELFKKQGGVCAICKQPPKMRKIGRTGTDTDSLSLDHDHKTGQVRGLLCQRCNFILGWMRDNPDYIEMVRVYLIKYEQPDDELEVS